MHSASRNPFVAIADALGFHYSRAGFPRRIRIDGHWASEADHRERDAELERYYNLIHGAAEAGRDIAVVEATERDGPWTPLLDYFISLWSSVDPDQVSVFDIHGFMDTGENWPVREGFGALIARFGADLPVVLNAAVARIDWSGKHVRLSTPRGEVRAGKVILTVSSGILGGGHIRFDPPLPEWKQEAAAALPLGNHNRICLVYERNVFGADHPHGAALLDAGAEPMSFAIRPFGYDYVVGLTGGRFAEWLERAGVEASVDLAKDKLKTAFGADIVKPIVGHTVTAWRGDPWVRGAYSAALPGQAHQRARLAEPLDERLYFAGEATSLESFSSVHGAYLTGIAAAQAAARAPGKAAVADARPGER